VGFSPDRIVRGQGIYEYIVMVQSIPADRNKSLSDESAPRFAPLLPSYRELEELRRRLDEVQRDLDVTRRELIAVRSSTSWRLTAPLRWFLDRLRGRTSGAMG
jgi:hypothetical protein